MNKIVVLLVFSFFVSCSSIPKGTGVSSSTGKVNKGTLKNGRRFPYSNDNYSYFSLMSYSLLTMARHVCKKSDPKN